MSSGLLKNHYMAKLILTLNDSRKGVTMMCELKFLIVVDGGESLLQILKLKKASSL